MSCRNAQRDLSGPSPQVGARTNKPNNLKWQGFCSWKNCAKNDRSHRDIYRNSGHSRCHRTGGFRLHGRQADTKILINGKERRLLDEVDGISPVSGGSFTAAYFGLFGNRIFEDFENKFLKRNVQSELLKRMVSPLSWPKLWSLYYDRSDFAADFYDELLMVKVNQREVMIVRPKRI